MADPYTCNNEPAYPTTGEQHEEHFQGFGPRLGMTLRDWFAAQANEGDIAAQQEWTMNTMQRGWPSNSKPKFTRSECRYKHADEMLKARERAKDEGKQ